jgi:prophage regulatory protein
MSIQNLSTAVAATLAAKKDDAAARLAADRLIRRKEVEHLTGKSRSGIYSDMALGSFPLAIKIGEKSVAWSELEILAWVSARMADRDAAGKGVA